MAQSFFQKIETLIKANLHAMVDEALDKNSVAVLDEYIRQAEDNLDDLEDALITVKGQVKTLRRKYETLKAEADAIDQDIDRLLELGKEELAVAAQSQYNTKVDLADEYRQQFLRQKEEADKLADARLKLETRLRTIKQEREHVLGLLELAKTKEIAAKSMKSLDSLDGVGDADIARVTDKIRSRIDRADAELEMRSGRLNNQMDEVLGRDRLNSQLAARKQRLGLEEEPKERRRSKLPDLEEEESLSSSSDL
ncbi:MAG: PspA/IM30 family protein [Anaerolineaceae bacterium]|nr:PspA/IM30 family protein [Anaerolineaceae bacterium]MCB9079742.1 PspA/IM30 family protein [Anaerolineaceae bacterium]